MEHWNKQELMQYKEMPSIFKVCDHYESIFHDEKIIYTLEIAQFLSYLEMYADGNDRKCIAKFEQGDSIYDAVKNLENGINPTLKHYQRLFRQTINKILTFILGDNFSLDSCLDTCSTRGNRGKTYIIYKNDLYFFMFLLAGYKNDETKALLNGKYDLISEQYFQLLRFGVEELIKNHNLNISKDLLDYCFGIRFGLFNRQIKRNLNYIEQTLNEFVKFNLQGANAMQQYEKCLDILSRFGDELMLLRNESFPPLSEEDIKTTEALKNIDEILSKYR